ncbi:MAG: HD domain-containing protein [Bacilli bacterium]|nr:HD domain-containing protein [Bacilli bacterium]
MFNLDNAIEEFEKFVKVYNMDDQKIKMKYAHTLRVCKIAKEIAISLNLNEQETDIAALIGLLHDIGRFEQIKRFNTFNDSESLDHGGFACSLLFEENYIRKFIKDTKYDNIIKKAIFYHNKRTIPTNLTKTEMLYAKLIRDADKIDIFYIYTETEDYDYFDDLYLKKDNFSEEIFFDIENHKTINLVDVKSKPDEMFLTIGWFYDLNYNYTFKEIAKNNFLDKLIDLFNIEDDHLKLRVENLKNKVASYIKEKLEGENNVGQEV